MSFVYKHVCEINIYTYVWISGSDNFSVDQSR